MSNLFKKINSPLWVEGGQGITWQKPRPGPLWQHKAPLNRQVPWYIVMLYVVFHLTILILWGHGLGGLTEAGILRRSYKIQIREVTEGELQEALGGIGRVCSPSKNKTKTITFALGEVYLTQMLCHSHPLDIERDRSTCE